MHTPNTFTAVDPVACSGPATAVSQLLLTKLYLPPVRPDLVPRRRLLDQVAVGLQGPLTLISAPPGFGKTSLFCAWRSSPEGAACRLAWLSLDPDDDDPARFLQYLTGALETAMPGAFAQVTMMFRLPQLPPIKTVLVGILNCLAISFEGAAEAGVRPLVLAFDDFHVIENPVIHEAIEYLLDHLPPCLRIVILSRTDPPLRLARMRARGQITEIHAGDLRFTTEESTQFLNDVMRLGLEPSEIAVLDARTEGWIAGLKLASLRLAQPGLGRQEVAHFIRTFQTSPRFAAEFLVEEVVSRQPPSVQEFLLCSSILERMCAPLCDAIRPTVEQYARETLWPAEEVIEHLTRRNLFIVPLDDEGCWYRYHHLFRDLLRARLAQLRPGQAIVLHRVASEWYEQQGLLKEAVKHAVLTKDWDYAAGMVERHGAEVLGRSDLRTLGEWCDAFPEEVMARRPALCVIHAWVLILSYNPDLVPAIAPRLALAESVANRLDATVVAPLAPGQPPVSVRAWVLGNVIQLRAAHMLSPSYVNFDAHVLFRVTKESMEMLAEAGDGVTDSVNFLNIAYAYMAMPDSHAAEAALAEARRRTIQGGNLFGGVTAVFYQAYLALCQGKLALVEDVCAGGRAELRRHSPDLERDVPAVRSLDIALACARLEQDDLSGAEAALTHALALSGWAPWVELPGWLALARLRGMQGDEQGLRSVLETLERFGPNVAVLAQGLRILNQLSDSPTGRETLAEACTWTGRIKPDRATRPPMGIKPSSYVVGYATYLVWAHLKVMLGEAHAALEFVEPALAVALQQNLLTRVIELSIVQALAHNILGESRQSREALERALAVAEQCGHVRTFDRGEQLKSLLAEAADRGHRRAQIWYILNAIGWPDGRAAPGKESASPSPSPCASIGKAVGQPRQVAAMLIEPISEREQEVLELIAAGLSNAEVAARLYIGIGTVKTHVNHLFGKLDASSRTQLLAKARLAGLLVEPRS